MSEFGLGTTIIGGQSALNIAQSAGREESTYTTKFAANVKQVVQMLDDQMAGTVQEESGVGSEEVQFMMIGKSTARENTTPFPVIVPGASFGSAATGDLSPTTNQFIQRWCYPREIFEIKTLQRNSDLHTKLDLKGAITTSVAGAINRKRASILLSAAVIDPAWEGAKGAKTQKAFPVSQHIANNGTGLSVAKIREAQFMLNDSDVPEEGRYLFYSAEQLTDALSDPYIIDRDYNTLTALQDGKVSNFLGFEWKRVSKDVLPYTTVGGERIRHVVCWQRDGMGRCIWRDYNTWVGQVPTWFMNWLLLFTENYGAVRVEDKRIVRIDCKETLTPAREADQAAGN